MLANEKLDPRLVREAEEVAERKWGVDWDQPPPGPQTPLAAWLGPLVEGDAPKSKLMPYDGFQWWHVLLTMAGNEAKAAKRLEKANLPIYLPRFTKQVKWRGRSHSPRLVAVVPGLIFVPREIMEIERRADTLKWACVYGWYKDERGAPEVISKAEIEKVRRMEALLNLPPEAKGVLFEVGDEVRFTDDLLNAWGAAVIFEIASEARIGVLVKSLFGRAGKIYVPASEIEVM